jgi:hypothetical protein
VKDTFIDLISFSYHGCGLGQITSLHYLFCFNGCGLGKTLIDYLYFPYWCRGLGQITHIKTFFCFGDKTLDQGVLPQKATGR